MLKDDELLTAIALDYRSAGLGPRRLAMLGYVEKLTRTPTAVTRQDVDALRGVGFNDTDVLHIVEVASYYAYANRIADGLGVVLEGGDRDEQQP